jgi:hypothetical protein
MLTPEEKILKQEQRLKRKQERNKLLLEKAYLEALKDPSLPEFRIKDGVILIKRISNNKLQQYKKIWLKELKEQIKEFTFENLCEYWNEPFSVSIRSYNPHDLILQYFYHKWGIDLIFPTTPYKIVDKF